MAEKYTIEQLRALRVRIAEVALKHRRLQAELGIEPEPEEDPREKGDDDGQEYGDPRDERDERRSER